MKPGKMSSAFQLENTHRQPMAVPGANPLQCAGQRLSEGDPALPLNHTEGKKARSTVNKQLGSQTFGLLSCPKLLCDRGQVTFLLWGLDARLEGLSWWPWCRAALAPPTCMRTATASQFQLCPLTTGTPPLAQVKLSKDGQARELSGGFPFRTNEASLSRLSCDVGLQEQ